MVTFDFPYHTTTHRYPEGDSFKFGRGYQFAANPLLPEQRTFILNFEGMIWFKDSNGVVSSSTGVAQLNMLKLIEFYETHRTNKNFIYPHEIYGNLTCKFAKPLEIPKSLKNGNGVTDSFELTLIEQLL